MALAAVCVCMCVMYVWNCLLRQEKSKGKNMIVIPGDEIGNSRKSSTLDQWRVKLKHTRVLSVSFQFGRLVFFCFCLLNNFGYSWITRKETVASYIGRLPSPFHQTLALTSDTQTTRYRAALHQSHARSVEGTWRQNAGSRQPAQSLSCA